MKKSLTKALLLTATFLPILSHAGVPEDIIAKFPQTASAKIAPAFSNFWSVVQGGEVIFISDDLKTLVNGTAIDVATNRNLTAELIDANKPKMNVAELDTRDAFLVKSSGKKKLYVFSDPDCPYCRSLEKTFDQLTGVSIYVFPLPLVSLHPNAATVSETLWCQKNAGQAWHAYLTTGAKPADAKCANPINKNIALASKYAINGTPAIIFEDGTILPGAASAKTIMDKLNQL